MTQKEYIKGVLIDEIGDVVKNHAFLSFTLIASAIEFLGICIDSSNSFFTSNSSGDRFRNAIDKLFPDRYKKYNYKDSLFDLYRELRCGVCHSTVAKTTIGFSERKHGSKHLFIGPDRRLVLVAEDFYDDFKKACENVIEMINDKTIQEKIYIQTP